MTRQHIYMLLLFVVGYFVGAKFPMIAQKVGVHA